jgi:hypothetical protein
VITAGPGAAADGPAEVAPRHRKQNQPHQRRVGAPAPQVQGRLVAARQPHLNTLILVDAEGVEVVQGHADAV